MQLPSVTQGRCIPVGFALQRFASRFPSGRWCCRVSVVSTNRKTFSSIGLTLYWSISRYNILKVSVGLKGGICSKQTIPYASPFFFTLFYPNSYLFWYQVLIPANAISNFQRKESMSKLPIDIRFKSIGLDLVVIIPK